jgi:hypothetical protein
MMELTEVLSGQSQAAPAPEPTPEPQPPPQAEPQTGETEGDAAPPSRPRDEQGRFAPKQADPTDAAPPAAKDPSGGSGSLANRESHGPIPIQALLDEREKRQRAERELDDLRRKVQPPQPPPRPDLFADPDGALNHVETRVAQEIARARLDMSVMMERNQRQDYDEKENAFVSYVQQHPEVYFQMLQDPHPAGFAYRVGAQVLASKEIGDPVSYRERLREELRQELQAELAQQQPAQPAQPAYSPQSFPSSLATARSSAPRGQTWTGPPSLDALGNPALRMR